MKRWILMSLLVFLSVSLVFASGAKEKQEQKVVVYSSVDEANAKKILDAFTADTGIKVAFVHLSSGPAIARIKAEINNPQADVWMGAPSENHIVAKEEGLTIPYKGGAFDSLAPQL